MDYAASLNIMAPTFKVKDPISALTHFIGFVTAILATPLLLVHASCNNASRIDLIALSVFMLSMIMLYGASASYHTFTLDKTTGLKLKKLDHISIFILIAGTYTPICVCVMRHSGIPLLLIVWGLAIAGIMFKLVWVTCPRWISSTIYISMGWVVIFAMPTIIPIMGHTSFAWLLIGGIIYTIGGILYALKLFRFNNRGSMWGSHEIFHLFVLGGSLCQYVCIYLLF